MLRIYIWLFAMVCLASCGGGGKTESAIEAQPEPPNSASPSKNSAMDARLSELALYYGLLGSPAESRSLKQVKPYRDPLVKLGQMLFFSQSLSGGFDVSCATCHLPQLGGSDGLSLPIGVVPVDRRIAGPARKLDVSRDQDPNADGGPNMHRNSITTFNAALFDRNLMSDGRIRVADPETHPGGHGQTILTPEASITGDLSGVDGLLQALSKFPLTNDNEMRGFYYSDLANPDSFRNHLVERLKGRVDQQYMTSSASTNWLQLFRKAFSMPSGSADELITLINIQKALGKYVESQIFVETPWSNYLDGNLNAISETERKGALLFYSDVDEGGLGCVSCHSGRRLTNEKFYNVGFPQIGRGFLRGDNKDLGRWEVTRSGDDMFSHRVPSLLNVAVTEPYGHAGTFQSLPSLLQYHVNPRDALGYFDFSLQQLKQFSGASFYYEGARALTDESVAHESFLLGESLLPNRSLSIEEETHLRAFLSSLTDVCVASYSCISAWTPDPWEDPDGNMFGGDNGPAPNINSDHEVADPSQYPQEIAFQWPERQAKETFSDVVACEDGMITVTNANQERFSRKDGVLGLTAPHGFSAANWSFDNVISIQYAMIAGGLTATYLNDDCWPDIVFAGGDSSGMLAYVNRGQDKGFIVDNMILSGTIPGDNYKRYTGVASADLDGDFNRELIFGNLGEGDVVVMSRNDSGVYEETARLPMSRNTYGISFSDSNLDGYLDMFLAHWSAHGVEGTAPAFWRNNNGESLLTNDFNASTISVVQHRRTFTPSFFDFRNVGSPDLVIASDFGTSMVLQNDGSGVFENITDSSVITDENGMGGVVGDFDNDGKADWFVTSVLDPAGASEANWGVTGNRLYMNRSTANQIAFIDATDTSGVRDGGWGWGVCKADFNNDGFLDIFHVNGFGFIPETLGDDGWVSSLILSYQAALANFIGVSPRLFMNNGNGTFSEASSSWGLDLPSEGRGVVCFDYDRDGDIDIGLLDHSKGVQFFVNELGHESGHGFLNVRLVGRIPNTDAIGARVTVIADVGSEYGMQSQMRASEANSNFNSQNPPDIHFGLGRAELVDIVVEWADGTAIRCGRVEKNQFLVFDQRKGLPGGCAWSSAPE